MEQKIQGQIQLSGANENWKTKNIYDLAGNVWEWIYEKYYSDFVYCGGGFNIDDNSPVSFYNADYYSFALDSLGYRVRLYIKTT